jgi:hypothetical protein
MGYRIGPRRASPGTTVKFLRRSWAWHLARSKNPLRGTLQCPLQIARSPVLDRSALAQLLEPPYTDPYVRWCGRGGAARLPPILIFGPTRPPARLLHVRSWREQTWRSFRGRRFLTHCGRRTKKHGAVKMSPQPTERQITRSPRGALWLDVTKRVSLFPSRHLLT